MFSKLARAGLKIVEVPHNNIRGLMKPNSHHSLMASRSSGQLYLRGSR